ncbi:hypothetical protein [Pseudodesulfovibrio piezophilus]|nr:hypothetical protein [Pseudodesulfovibrio piezophilus]
MADQMNLFKAYSGGNREDLEHMDRLENNVTRAFVITLQYIHADEPDVFRRILGEITGDRGKRFEPKQVWFDLQSGTQELVAAAQKDGVEKIILAISSRKEETPRFSCVTQFDRLLKDYEDVPDNDQKKFLKSLAKWQKKGESEKEVRISLRGTEYSFSPHEAENVYRLVHDNIPDGWIVAPGRYAILIESKIGSGRICEEQLFRHATGNKGFKLSAQDVKNDGSVQIVCVTWGKVCDALVGASKELKGMSLKITEQFLEYMEMSGEKLNFEFFLRGAYDENGMRNQFPLLVDKMQQKLKERDIPLEAENRPLTGVWQRFKYGAEGDMFYTLRASEGGVEISLTAHNSLKKKLYLNKAWAGILWDMCSGSGKWLRHRYQVMLHDYRLVDRQKGQMKGESQELFNYRFTLGTVGTKGDLDSLVEIGKQLVKLKDVKQLDMTFKVGVIDGSKIKHGEEGTLRAENAKLLSDPETLLESFCDFVENTFPVYMDVLKHKSQRKGATKEG